ncbi:MAG: 23S rRNA (guanosine(2251)-2'-O)-methyltransferase RlmB [Epulopiscium sp.]|jgi:TrmH family RNA methyltransferase|nr:23S rRNA (guanosine(2251)-2'-O)-methyltransferase RlmB [Candidatus Epulonipiscium sp.]
MIESIQNKHIKWLLALQKNRKNRMKEKLFVVEGIKIIEEIPNDWEIVHVFVSNSFIKENALFLNKIQINKNNIIEVSDKLFNTISDTVTPQGVLAVCKQKMFSLNDVLSIKEGFFIILEEIQDPGNLGTIIRTADAAGVDAIFITKGSVDLYNPKVIRSTMGSIFHLPIFTDMDIDNLIEKLKDNNVSTLSAHLKANIYPYQYNFNKAIALLIGNEAKGIKDSTSKKTDMLLKIPMQGKAESLNAAVAAGILMYEVVRQRISKIN